ncbi:MAG: nucleoside-diphosphate-sugar epimerase [Flavobacteriales bacterium]|jgi:nucleoside-diphosphate-sugar epimerase
MVYMKILFIGGTGNISMASSKRLLAAGHDLWLLTRTGACAELPAARCLKADINDASAIEHLLCGHEWDVVVNWIAFTADDITRDVALFSGSTQQYVFISSASCYQNPSDEVWIREGRRLDNPYWEYSQNKILAEQALMQAYEQSGFPATIVRPSLTYERVIPLSLGAFNEYTTVARIKAGKEIVVPGDGNALWTLTHSQDFAQGICGLLGNRQAIGEDFHITSDEFLSWNQIYSITAEVLGCEARIVHVTSDTICALEPRYRGTLLGDKSHSALFDNRKIKLYVPEFAAKISYRDGIRSTLAWFEEDQDRQRVDIQTDAFIEQLIQTTK